MRVPLLSVVVGLTVTTTPVFGATDKNVDGAIPPEATTGGFYQAYSHYPDYCSTPSMMESRQIPPLVEHDSRIGETRLVHVTTLIRHGARTPADTPHYCWEGYWDTPWNCDLTLKEAPPPSHDGDNTVVLFEKHYDALLHPQDNLSNELQGTCQKGQLLRQGLEQHVTNGNYLRDAYLYDSSEYQHNVKMRLIDDKSQNGQPWAPPQLYVRSDDDQRFQLSGEILARAMFFDEELEQKASTAAINIPIHLADRSRDIISVNEDICPRLKELRINFEHSSIFKSFNHSQEATELRAFMTKELKAKAEIPILDCLMPTVCTDRPLPKAFRYEAGNDMFDRMVNFVSVRFGSFMIIIFVFMY